MATPRVREAVDRDPELDIIAARISEVLQQAEERGDLDRLQQGIDLQEPEMILAALQLPREEWEALAGQLEAIALRYTQEFPELRPPESPA